MIKYVSLKDFSDYNKLIEIWNEAVNNIFPIDEKLFKQNTSENTDVLDEGSVVAIVNEQAVGFIATKIWRSNYEIPAYKDTGFINAIAVKPQFQKQGIGSELLKIAESALVKEGKKLIHIGRDTYNYFPGVPFDFLNTKKWLEKRGYINERHTHDVKRTIEEKTLLQVNDKIDYHFKIATLEDKEAMLEFFEKCFKGRWAYDCLDYFNKGGTGREYLIILDGKKVIGFCRVNDWESKILGYNTNWRLRFKKLGGIGPLGVDPAYRKQHLGYEVTARAINILLNRDVSDIIIDWTSLVDFYRKFGFEVWKAYYYMHKQL